ncbi:hypothetical protein GFS31_44110 (plasmid) [Leptolyngbya sp. BL0902]|nr:hypothetical protein GFS31_44110 [Leptolyngbya sp. BL0902]
MKAVFASVALTMVDHDPAILIAMLLRVSLSSVPSELGRFPILP